VLALALVACTSMRSRGGVDEVRASQCWLPAGARPGMFITWVEQDSPACPDGVRERTIACVAESGGVVTMEQRETRNDGSTEVIASRFRRDGTLVDAWRGPAGGVGAPVRVGERMTREAMEADTERMRAQYSLPRPDVSTAQSTEDVETTAGRVRCVRETTKVSMLFVTGVFTTWHAVTPLPLSSSVKSEMDLPGMRMVSLLSACGTTGARPTLSIPGIPPSGR
jgi:hypothetical protein